MPTLRCLTAVLLLACGGSTPPAAEPAASTGEPTEAEAPPPPDPAGPAELSVERAHAMIQAYFSALMSHDREALAPLVAVPHTMDTACQVVTELDRLLDAAEQFSEQGDVVVEMMREVESADGLEGELAGFWAQLDPEPGACDRDADNEAQALAATFERRVFLIALHAEEVPDGYQTLVRLSLVDGEWRVTGAGF